MLEIKQQLVKAVVDLLNDEFEIESITVRQIAYEANTSVGIINYHFGSKWKLIVEAVSLIIDEAVKESFETLSNIDDNPNKKLRTFLKSIAIVVCKYQKYTQLLIKDELLSDRFSTPETILDILSEIKPELKEKEIKYLAVQIVAPIQYIFLKSNGLKTYLGEPDDIILLEEYEEIMEHFLKALGI